MFCPNCGNNCGDAKFCVKCGTKIQQEATASTAWAPGMACPHCGGTKIEGDCCAFCGAKLTTQQSKTEDLRFPDPPLGKYSYWGHQGYIIVSDHYIRIFRAEIPQWGWARKDRTIYFKDLYAMKFVPAKSYAHGMLSIRTWDERAIPFPQGSHEVETDECSVDFVSRSNGELYKVALFLQQCVRIANNARAAETS